MPVANGFLTTDELDSPEPTFPLDVSLCRNCGLAQLLGVVEKEYLFRTYPYFSSVTKTLPKHFALLAKEIRSRFLRSGNELVVEVGSNDGVLLSALKDDVQTLGIEPATNIAEAARAQNIETINNFFSEALAHEVVDLKRRATVVIANNVMAHVNDLHDFVRGIRYLIDDEGVFVFEVPYLVDLLEKNEYDTIYHEHLSYFAIRPLMALFREFGMRIFDVTRLEVHGGSIRVYVCNENSTHGSSDAVERLLELEEKRGLQSSKPFLDFAERVGKSRDLLLEILTKLKNDNKKVAGYGAPAKGNVLLNYCGIDTTYLDFLSDSTPFKQGLYTPGTHIPVYHPDQIEKARPEYMLMLAWNYQEEIVSKEKRFRSEGGRFIVPIPVPQII